MELRHLRAFCAVAQEMHVTKAAKRLKMAQPALTQQIRLLERDMGLQLVLPNGRGIKLTQAGSFFHKEAEAILTNLHNACLKTKELARGESGTLRIGVTEGASFNPSLAAIFTAYRASYPGVQLTFSQTHSPELAADLRHNLIDVAFMCPLPDPEGITMSPLYNEEMMLAFPIEHRFSGQTVISLKHLQDEPLLLISHGNTVRSLESELTAACEKLRFSPRIAQTVPEFMLALNLVASGVGLTFVPTYMTSIHTKRICYKRLRLAEGITMETVVALRADETANAAHNLHSLACELFKKRAIPRRAQPAIQ